MSIYYFTEYDTKTRLPIRSKYNFDFTKYASDRNLNTSDKNIIFEAFEKENGKDFSKPTKTLPQLIRYFTPMTNAIINYINKYGQTIHTNYMSSVYINTYTQFSTLVQNQFELIEYNDTQIRFIQDYFYKSVNNVEYCTKYNFDFVNFSKDFNVWGSKLVVFTEFMVRSIYLNNSVVGAYGYGLPDSLKKYFLIVDNLEKYLIQYSVTSDLSYVYKYPDNIDYKSYGEMNPDLLLKNLDVLKDHYLHYGQFELRHFNYNTKPRSNYDILRGSAATIVSIGSTSTGSGFLYNYVGDNKIYLITCFHIMENSRVINIIRGSFSYVNSNNPLDEGINVTADFAVVGYDKFADILVTVYEPKLDYNVNEKNESLINKLPRLFFDNDYELELGEEVSFLGNMGFYDNASLLSGKIIDKSYDGPFHTTTLGHPSSLLIQSQYSKGFSGSPICVGDMTKSDGNIKCLGMLNSSLANEKYTQAFGCRNAGNIKCLGMNSSVANEKYTQAIGCRTAGNIISNIILGYDYFGKLYRNDIVSLNYTQRFGLPPKWLGAYGTYYNSSRSIFKCPELKSMSHTGGYVLKKFIVGFDTIQKKFITNPFELGKSNNIRLFTPLLNSKIYRQFCESSNRPIVIKSITFLENSFSSFQKFDLGKYGNQKGLNLFTYGFNPIATTINPDTSYFFPFILKYQNVKFEYYYYNGIKYVLNTETIISDESTYTVNTDGLGNKFYQSKWEFPFSLLSYLESYCGGNTSVITGPNSGNPSVN